LTHGFTLKAIADLVEGRLEGPEELTIYTIRPLDQAGPRDLSFAVGKRLREAVEKTKACALILPEGWPFEVSTPAIYVKNPYLAFALVCQRLFERPFTPRGVMDGAHIGKDVEIPEEVTIYPGVYIGEGASIGRRVTIYPGVYIGENCIIGEDTTIYPNCTIYHGTRIGDRCILHAGAVIGSDGFGYAQDRERFVKIPQVGIVVIEDDCEIGANTTIDRATLGETRIQRGTKIDNLVQIAHNCSIGENSAIVAQAGIAGSTTLGRNCMIGGQVGIVGHLHIGDRVKVAAQSGVAKDIPDDTAVLGAPALPHRIGLKVSTCLKRLPELFKEVSNLKRSLKQLKEEGK